MRNHTTKTRASALKALKNTQQRITDLLAECKTAPTDELEQTVEHLKRLLIRERNLISIFDF